MKRLGLLAFCLLVAAAGCTYAGRMQSGVFVSEHFEIAEPGPDWEVVRNYQAGKTRLVDFRHLADPVDIRVREIGLTKQQRAIPLTLLSEALFFNAGRPRGLTTKVTARKRIDLGDHEAIAVFGTRSDGATTRQLAQIYLRAGLTLFVVSYIAPPEVYPKYASDLHIALQSFDVRLPADPPEIALPTPTPTIED